MIEEGKNTTINGISITEIDVFENVIEKAKIITEKINESLSKIIDMTRKVFEEFKPFFKEYGYDIDYLNKVAYMAKHAKKKRVRNKYRNMIKRTLGEEKLHRILED